jgi:hypothetical protein
MRPFHDVEVELKEVLETALILVHSSKDINAMVVKESIMAVARGGLRAR